MNDPELFDGGADPDWALVGAGPPVMSGGGDDVLYGGGDVDNLLGGPGDDLIGGGPGADILSGGDNNDTLSGDEDGDGLYGGAGNDIISTGTGGDSLPEFVYGEDGDDIIFAYAATWETLLDGGIGNDRIEGSEFADFIVGGNGQEVIAGHGEDDTINGNDGTDVLWSNGPGSAADQPWRANGQGNPNWFDMDASGPDNDGDCDIEDGHADLDHLFCFPNSLVAVDDNFGVSHTSFILHSYLDAPNVLSNDSNSPPAQIQVTHYPIHGTLVMYDDGTFDYDPDDDFVGTDDFYYQLVDFPVTSVWPARVAISVTNSAPVANNDGPWPLMYNPYGVTATTFNVLSNDTDADGDDIDIVDPPGSPVVTTPPTKGFLTVDHETGQIIYTYTGPNPGMMPTFDSFSYKAKDDWNESNTTATVNINIMGSMLLLDLPPVEPSPDTPSNTDADLALLANEAVRRWVAAGVDAGEAQRAREGTKFVIDDLPGSMLGMYADDTIFIDVNAAGYGWFVDATESLDEEFNIEVAPSEFQAGRGSKAFGYVDALTVLMHEFGHAIGMVHLEGVEFEHSVMHDTIGLSTRRIPTKADIAASDAFYALLAESGSPVKRRRW